MFSSLVSDDSTSCLPFPGLRRRRRVRFSPAAVELLDDVPNEIWCELFLFLSFHDISNSVLLVSRKFREIASTTYLWESLVHRDFPRADNEELLQECESLEASLPEEWDRWRRVYTLSLFSISLLSFIPYKTVLLGDTITGKTSSVLRYVHGRFHHDQESTIGAAFLTKTQRGIGNMTVKYEIWDTAGQERYQSLAYVPSPSPHIFFNRPMYYRGAAAIFIFFDPTVSRSFDRARTFIREIRRNASPVGLFYLVASRVDLVTSNPTSRQVSEKIITNYTDSLTSAREPPRYGGYFEVSALLDEGIDEMFKKVAVDLQLRQIRNVLKKIREGTETIEGLLEKRAEAIAELDV